MNREATGYNGRNQQGIGAGDVFKYCEAECSQYLNCI